MRKAQLPVRTGAVVAVFCVLTILLQFEVCCGRESVGGSSGAGTGISSVINADAARPLSLSEFRELAKTASYDSILLGQIT
jgi:hypothetical protein